MDFFVEAFTSIRDFFETGGNVLWGILIVTTLMWTLIIERLWFFNVDMPGRARQVAERWDAREDTSSWQARRIREQLISEVSVQANASLLMIKTLMAVLPLLGLLGTVTGMISVFDTMAVLGTGNARAMAGGVSKATIPTMSGLVAALSGLYLSNYLQRRADVEVERVEDALGRH